MSTKSVPATHSSYTRGSMKREKIRWAGDGGARKRESDGLRKREVSMCDRKSRPGVDVVSQSSLLNERLSRATEVLRW